jgi:dTDP-4-dehydrorhamnose reductase
MKILVPGAGGQLGQELKELSKDHPQHDFFFFTKEDLDITDKDAVEKQLRDFDADYCINCAAYTAVDKAESDQVNAFVVNGDAVANLAVACRNTDTRFIHISTDYVFDGTGDRPYLETDAVAPLNIYGQSKLKGEEACMQLNPDSVVIRTSWVYSYYGNNFVKTMLRLMRSKPELNIVADQRGCPTNAADLAKAIMTIIDSGIRVPGIFNYSNEGITTWFEFASAIKGHCGFESELSPITTEEYITPAKRPLYSVLDTSKIRATYAINIRHWKTALEDCLQKLDCKA